MIVPIIYEYFLNILFMYLPIVKPKNVNEKLQIVKVVDANKRLFVMADNPNPTEKLSRDTPNANNIIPIKLKEISLLVGFRYSINSCNDNKIKIIPNNISGFIINILFIKFENTTPNIGIIKWNNPTVKLVLNVFFRDKLYIPIQVDTENASILRLIPIINKISSSFNLIT